jgi:hypothetical protein
MAASMGGLARCYEMLNQAGIALIWLKKARALGDQLTIETRRDVLRALELLNEKQGDSAAAADCRREMATLKERCSRQLDLGASSPAGAASPAAACGKTHSGRARTGRASPAAALG